MIIVGYLLAVLMGLTLGLVGAGGSILTVPILVYLLGVKPVIATGYSLLVVGVAALIGAIRYFRHGLVNISAALMFAVPAMLTVLATRKFIVPAIPEIILGINKDIFIMLLFAALMVTAALFMFKPLNIEATLRPRITALRAAKLILVSAGIGLLTGMVGAGGGFLIIPTLIALFGLHVKEAIGTSLTIIAINSLIGFRGDISAGIMLDWHLLSSFIGLTLLGMLIGTSLVRYIKAENLKKIFSIFTLLIGISIFAEKLYTLFT